MDNIGLNFKLISRKGIAKTFKNLCAKTRFSLFNFATIHANWSSTCRKFFDLWFQNFGQNGRTLTILQNVITSRGKQNLRDFKKSGLWQRGFRQSDHNCCPFVYWFSRNKKICRKLYNFAEIDQKNSSLSRILSGGLSNLQSKHSKKFCEQKYKDFGV